MNPQAPLLPATSVHDRRNLPLWVALAFSAGAVNAAALAACQRFVSHVTGTVTRIGADYDSPRLLLDYGAVLAAFVVGAMSSFWLLDGRRLRGRPPLVAAPLLLVGGLLFTVALAGRFGAFGPFGTTVETAGDFVLLGLLAFAMGLQNAAVATTSGMIVRTTHMTGPLTDLAIALGAYVSPGIPSSVRDNAKRSILLRGAKVAAFALGALVATGFAPRLEYLTFFIPAAIVLVAAYGLHGAVRGEESAAEAPPRAVSRASS